MPSYHFRVCTDWGRGSPRSGWPGRRPSSWAADTCRTASAKARRCYWWGPDNFAGTPRRRCPPTWRRSKVSARSGVETLNLPRAARRRVSHGIPPPGLSADCSIPATRTRHERDLISATKVDFLLIYFHAIYFKTVLGHRNIYLRQFYRVTTVSMCISVLSSGFIRVAGFIDSIRRLGIALKLINMNSPLPLVLRPFAQVASKIRSDASPWRYIALSVRGARISGKGKTETDSQKARKAPPPSPF